MKKSFLITLAAVSSVALIGCSSSSDDNNGGQGGGGSESTYAKPEVTVELVAKDSTYLVQNVLNTNQGDNAADLQFKVVCDAATDEANLVVDNTNDKIGYLATAATSDVKCTVTFDGEKDANTKTEITFNGTNDKTEKELVNVSKKGDDAALTINGSDITFAADEKSTPHSVIFKTVKAASYTKGEGVLNKAEDQAGEKLIKLAATDLDGVATIKTEACKAEQNGAISCEVELKSKSAVANGKITATGAGKDEVVELVSNVVITEAGEPSPEQPQPGEAKAIEVKPVTDAHVGSTLDQITYLGVIENAAITAETKLYCADKTTADAILTACNTDKIVSQKAEAGKLYFAAKTFGGKQSVALVNAEGTLLEGTLPSAQLSDTAPVLQQFVHATFQSAAAANADATDANTAVTNNKVVLGDKGNIAFVVLEYKAPKDGLFTYNSSDAALERTKNEAINGVQVAKAEASATALKVELNKGGIANIGGKADSTTAVCSNQDQAKCIIKVTVDTSTNPWEDDTTLPITIRNEAKAKIVAGKQ